MSWSGEIDLTPSLAIFSGPGGGSTTTHAHTAHKMVIAPEGDVEIEGAQSLDDNAWWVEANSPHRLAAPGPVMLVFFDAAEMAEVGVEKHQNLMLQARDALLATSDRESRCEIAQSLADKLPQVQDHRVRQAASILRNSERVPMAELSEATSLSSTRLTHLFSDQVGIPPRAYRTWGLLVRAVDHMSKGVPLTEIAHSAGFTDSAHLARIFMNTLGVSPSSLSGDTSIIVRI